MIYRVLEKDAMRFFGKVQARVTITGNSALPDYSLLILSRLLFSAKASLHNIMQKNITA